MKNLATLALGTSLTLLAGAALAQSSTSTMSASDQATMTRCKGMSQSAMQADKDCMAMMKKNPDMMKGTTGSNMGTSTGSGTGMKK